MNKCSTGIFIGMDVSEKSITIYALPSNNENGKETVIANDASVINKFFDQSGEMGNLTVAMETGTHSPWMSELLESRGCKVLVGHARALRMIWGSDHKCDGRDAEMLARIAKADPKLLNPIKHRSMDSRKDLAVIKARDVLVKSSTMMINYMRGILKSFGIKNEEIKTADFSDGILKLIPRELIPALTGVVQQLKHVKKEIKRYDKMIDKLCKKYPETEKLRQVSGVGPLTALAFVLIITDPNRFPCGQRLASYLGLVPERKQSGETDEQLGITKAGNGLLRRYLVQASNYIMGPFCKDCDLRTFGTRIASRGGKIAKRKAKVAVARKLAVLLRKLWISDEAYVPDYKMQKRKNRNLKKVA